MTLIINEFEDIMGNNQIFEAAELYLGNLTKSSSSSSSSLAHRLRVSKPESEKHIQVAVDQDEEVVDVFDGVKFVWVLHIERNENSEDSMHPFEIRDFHLTFHKKYKDFALEKYLPYLLNQAALLKQKNKTIKLFTIHYACRGEWSSVNFDHPSTFETLAMPLGEKMRIIDDLDMFIQRKDYYRQVRKASKRGYLLYGPPGMGKSSLIAAMANYLNFDIYNLQLSKLASDWGSREGHGENHKPVHNHSGRHRLLHRVQRSEADSKSDSDKSPGVTLSAFLNSIDGLWSSCGDEKTIVFTTNHKEKLDPALLRPGKMDMHIPKSYCTPNGFKDIAKSYFVVQQNDLFDKIEKIIDEARVTPAVVAEQLIKHHEPDDAFEGLLHFLTSEINEGENEQLSGAIAMDKSNGSSIEDEQSVRESVKILLQGQGHVGDL